jgi:menaquinone-dependent protoporphyrinogen oxidase
MSEKPLSRRDFSKVAGITMAATSLACSGLDYAATRSPEAETPNMAFGKEKTMENRILIAYATRVGSTVEVATAIGERLSQEGFGVDVKSIKQEPNLDEYRAAILGSAIRMGSWLPEAVRYIEANQQVLRTMPVALFTVHMLNSGEDEISRTNRLAYLDKIRPLLNQPEEVYFEGKMDFSRLSLADRLISKMVKAEEADKRDWEKIRNWVPEILAKVQDQNLSN